MADDTDTFELQQSGANARALGRSSLDNPYYRSDQMPGTTGEPIEEWKRKAESWSLGWEIEDMIREGRGIA